MGTRFTEQSSLARNILWRALPAFFVAVLVALCFFLFTVANKSVVNNRNTLYINEYTETMGQKLDVKLKGALAEIELVASSVGLDEHYGKVTLKKLAQFEQTANFDFIRYVDASGALLTSSGATADSTGREYFENGISGKSGITFVEKSRINSERMAVCYAPCVRDNKVIGVFLGLFKEETLASEVETFFDNQRASSFIIARTGSTIVVSPSSSMERWFAAGNSKDFDNWVSSGFTDESNTEKLISAYTDGTETTFDYQGSSDATTGCIVPLSTVDWSLAILFPSSMATHFYQESYAVTRNFGIALIGVFALYFVILVVMQLRRSRREREAFRLDRYLARAQDRISQGNVFVDLEQQTYVDVSATPMVTRRTGTYDELVEQAVAAQDNEVSVQDTYAFFYEKVLDCRYDDEPRILDTVFTSPGGEERFFRTTFVPVESVGTRVTKGFLLFNDVSRAKRRDKAVKEQLAQSLEQAKEGVRSKNAFLANMSHDLRTPLNAILGYTALAKSNAADASAVEDYADKIAASGGQLLKLVDEVLEVSSMDGNGVVLSRDHVSLDRLVEGVQGLVAERFAGKGQTLSVDTGGVRHRDFIADERHLQQVLQKLLSNASKYSPHGGEARLLVEELPARNADEVRLRFVVSDNGIGITEEFLPYVFDAFMREQASVTNKQPGTGLGLPIVKRLVELMDGTIRVESVKGEGSVFTVELELPIAAGGDSAAVEGAPAADVLQGKSFLAAEDNPINAEILVELLAQKGASCRVCPDGAEAAKAFEGSKGGDYDAILMDVMMPVMDGLEAARAIRASAHPQAKSIPIIAMTANTFQEDKDRSREAGMNAHLGKPIDMDGLEEALARLSG